jgi:hypothetical protein
MTEQLELRPYEREPEAGGRLKDLVNALRGRGWVPARQLRKEGFSDRELREIGEGDERAEILSYPGSPGDRLFSEATLQEIGRCVALKSQARGMLRKFIRYQRQLHGKL